jgi:DNA-binding response OmpR family regulator
VNNFLNRGLPFVTIVADAGSTRLRNRPVDHQRFGIASWALQNLVAIMVVEDDPLVQALLEDAFTEAGFEPSLAGSGEEAITLLRGNRSHYRALVTDINLPGRLDGWEVAKQARQISPAFPIIYITGAAAGEWASHGVPNSVLLTKPFATAQLVTTVARLLNNDSPTP